MRAIREPNELVLLGEPREMTQLMEKTHKSLLLLLDTSENNNETKILKLISAA